MGERDFTTAVTELKKARSIEDKRIGRGVRNMFGSGRCRSADIWAATTLARGRHRKSARTEIQLLKNEGGAIELRAGLQKLVTDSRRERHCERAAAGGGGALFRTRKRSAPSLKVTASTAPESRSFASSATCLENSATGIGSQPSCSSPIPWNVSTCQQSGRTHPPTFSLFEI